MENEEVDTEDEKEPEMESKEELEFVVSRLTTRVLIENYSKVSCDMPGHAIDITSLVKTGTH